MCIRDSLLPLMKKYEDYTQKKVFCFYHLYSTFKNFNRAINLGLKQIGKILKIDDLEYYAARHSWATLAVNKVGIDKYTVHAALNHIDEAMRVTDIYIERDFKICLLYTSGRSLLHSLFRHLYVCHGRFKEIRYEPPAHIRSCIADADS